MRTTSAPKRGFQNYNEYVYGLVLKSRYTVVSLQATGAVARCCESRQFAPSSRFLMRMFRSSLVGRCYVNLNQPSVSLSPSLLFSELSVSCLQQTWKNAGPNQRGNFTTKRETLERNQKPPNAVFRFSAGKASKENIPGVMVE